MKYLCLTLFIAFSLSLPAAFAEIAIIVHPSSPIAKTDPQELKRLYLGKLKTLDGKRADPVNQAPDNAITEKFNTDIINKTRSQVKAYWSKLIFTGKGKPPTEVSDDKEMIRFVAADKSAVGYVSAESVDNSVKVILKF